MSNGNAALTYAVRLSVVGKYLAQLALMLAGLALVPAMVALLFGEHAMALRYGLLIGALLVCSVPGFRVVAPEYLQNNEALVIVALAFVLAPLAMTFPLMGSGLGFVDAWFEGVSGITTTGLSVVADPGAAPMPLLFARSWMQWYGGLGIVVLSVALLMGHHMAARRLTRISGTEDIRTTARAHARRVLLIYAGVTVVGAGGLWLLTGEGMASAIYALSGVSTGGFSPHTGSLAGLDGPAPRAWVSLLALIGAMPLVLVYGLFLRKSLDLLRDMEVRFLVVAIGVLALLVWMVSVRETAGLSPVDAALLAMNTHTTAGFSPVDLSEVGAGIMLLLLPAMLVGGAVGSTAGGIKILRLLIFYRVTELAFRRTAMPQHAFSQPELAGRQLDPGDLQGVMVLLFLVPVLVFVSWCVFVFMGYAPLVALFEVVSAVGTVGLSAGVTGAELPTQLKVVLAVDMLAGRLEMVALLILFYPRTWIGNRRSVA